MPIRIKNNTAATNAHVYNRLLAAQLAAVNGPVAVAAWIKFPKEFSATWFYQAYGEDPALSNSLHNSFLELYYFDANTGDGNYDRLTVRSQRNGADGVYATDTTIADQSWHLIVINFQAGGVGKSAYSYQLSVDGGAFITGSGSGQDAVFALSNIVLGRLFASNNSFSTSLDAVDVNYAFVAHRSGWYTTDDVAAMYGSGPDAGDGVDPYSIDTGDIINYTRFDDEPTAVIGHDWIVDGDDFDWVDDKPAILEATYGSYEIYLTRDRVPDVEVDEPWSVAASDQLAASLFPPSLAFGSPSVDGRYFGFVVPVNEVGSGPESPIFEAEIQSGQFKVLPAPVSDLRASPLSGGRLDVRWKHSDANPYIKPTDFEVDGEFVLDAGGTTPINQVVDREGLKSDYQVILGPYGDGVVTIGVAARNASGNSHAVAPVISARTDATPPVATPLQASVI